VKFCTSSRKMKVFSPARAASFKVFPRIAVSYQSTIRRMGSVI
jgi:hypothetical protein